MILIQRYGIRNFECHVFIWGNNSSGPDWTKSRFGYYTLTLQKNPLPSMSLLLKMNKKTKESLRFKVFKYISCTELRDGKVVQYKNGLTVDRIQLVSSSKMWFLLDQCWKKQETISTNLLRHFHILFRNYGFNFVMCPIHLCFALVWILSSLKVWQISYHGFYLVSFWLFK